MPGAQGPKTVKGAQSDPNYVIRLCTGISQNHHPCLLTLPFRAGRYLLFRNLFLARGAKFIITPLHASVLFHTLP